MSIIPPSSSPADFSYRRESEPQPLSWRQRLALFFRGNRRSRYKPKAITQAPPRLGPIGDDVLRFDTKASLSPNLNTSGLITDFGALKFDDQGGLAGGFNINFDMPPSTSPSDSKRESGAFNSFNSGNGNVAGKKGAIGGVSKRNSGAKSPKRSNSRRTGDQASTQNQVKGHAKAPSLEVKGLEEGGFLDTWMKESEKKEQERELAKKLEDAKEETKRLSMVSAYSVGSSRKPLTVQATETGVAATGPSRESSVKRSSNGYAFGENVPYSKRSLVSTEPVGIPGAAAAAGMFGKRKAEDQTSGTSPPKMQYRTSLDRTKNERDSLMMPPPGLVERNSPQLSGSSSAFRTSPQIGTGPNASPQFGSTSTFRARDSLDYSTVPGASVTGTGTESGRSTSLASKRLSTSSMTSFTSGQYAQRLEYSRPQAGAKVVDSDSVSIASTATSSGGRRFEIKTETGLLKPVTSTSADKAARQVSQTISRINSNSINSSTFASPTSAPRSVSGGRPGASGVSKPNDEVIAARRLSQPYNRNSYVDTSTGSQLSRTPTPDSSAPEVTARSRRSSSRLSDRMSWINNLEDPSKNSGRDFVFRKLEGGVAAKLSAFEAKASGETPVATPARGLSRSNSISKGVVGATGSGASSSDAYGIERIPSNLTRRSTIDDQPGKVEDKVGEGFKKKLEGVMGGVAEKLEKKQSIQGMAGAAANGAAVTESSASRGPASLAQKKKLVPKDVMDLIELSGVDQEVAINEYLEQHRKEQKPGQLGRTKTWDHDELMKQINDGVGKEEKEKAKAKETLGATPEEEKTEEQAVKPVEPSLEKKIEEKPAAVVVPVVAPVEKKEIEQPKDVPEPFPEPVKPVTVAPVVAAIPAPVETAPAETKSETLTVEEPTLGKKKSFHGAMLPSFD